MMFRAWIKLCISVSLRESKVFYELAAKRSFKNLGATVQLEKFMNHSRSIHGHSRCAAGKIFMSHSCLIHAHSCCAAGEKSTLVYNFLAPIYRWYMLVYRPYTDGISPIYRWYIAHIPILNRTAGFLSDVGWKMGRNGHSIM